MPDIDLSFLGSGLNPTGTTMGANLPGEDFGGSEMNSGVALVQELLSRLDAAQPKAPAEVGKFRQIIGALGDAITAAGAVRGGGQAPQRGQFASMMQERQAAYEAQKTAYENRKMQVLEAQSRMQERADQQEFMNRLRIAQFEKPVRTQLKMFSTVDSSRRPVIVPYIFNPTTSTVTPAEGYESGFSKFLRPLLAQGINQNTGELEYRLIEPLIDAVGAPSAAPGGGQGGGAAGTKTVTGFGPKPTTAEMEGADAAAVIGEQLAQYKTRAGAFSQRVRVGGTARALGQNVIRNLPGGQDISEVYGDPQFEELAALRDRIGQQLARLVESGRLSDQDREFALRNLPGVAALTTENGRKAAVAKIALVEQEIAIRLQRKGARQPGLVNPGGAKSAADLADELLNE